MPGNNLQQNYLRNYLRSYAEPEADLTLPSGCYSHALVIPTRDENWSGLCAVWQDIPANTSFLVILVVNSGEANDPAARALVDAATRNRPVTTLADNVRLVTGDSPHLLIVDRYSPGYLIPKKQGVGLARKIGMDIAVQLVEQGTLESSWLFTTDADVHLPANYFELEPMQGDAALLPRFRHTAPKDRAIAMQLYEASMLYYVAGLRFAGSPYAYPTIGSLISCSAENYAAVRGFPKRNTGEDFYLLNKLRKLGEVRCVNHVTIEISGRNSERVPIGTGAAVTRIGGMSNPMSEFTVEHPDCYTTLRLFLTALNELAGTQPLRSYFPDPELARYADEIGLLTHYETKRRQQPSTSVMSKHLHDWFDALKTRQLIHHLRDSRFGSVTIPSLGSASFLSGETTPGAIQAALAARIYGT